MKRGHFAVHFKNKPEYWLGYCGSVRLTVFKNGSGGTLEYSDPREPAFAKRLELSERDVDCMLSVFGMFFEAEKVGAL